MKQSFIWPSSIRWERRTCDPVSLSKGDTEGLYQMKWDGLMVGFPVSEKYWFRQIYDLSHDISEAVANRDTAAWRVSFTWWRMAFWCRIIAMRSDARSPSLTPRASHYGNNDALSLPQVSGEMYSYGPNKIRGKETVTASPGIQSCLGLGRVQGC